MLLWYKVLYFANNLNLMQNSFTFKSRRLFMALAFLCLSAGLIDTSLVHAAAQERFLVTEQVVEDRGTGLQWARDANIAARPVPWDEAIRFVSMMNKRKYANRNDWRLPDMVELKHLLTSLRKTGTASEGETAAALLKQAGFLNVEEADYWTSTSSIFNETEAWYIGLRTGEKVSGSKMLRLYVLPVRWQGKPPEPVKPKAPGTKSQ